MQGFHPYFTSDGSVGLYNDDFKDIYHSATGALTEAYEKFIFPINFDFLLVKPKIRILDICYGIGYNTKSFLNFILFLEKFSKKNFSCNKNIVPIYTDNISTVLDKIYTDTIDTDNIFDKISVTAIDNDKFLSYLSPFVKTGVKNFSNNNLDFSCAAAEKFLCEKSDYFPKIDNLINFAIFVKIAQNNPVFFSNKELLEVLHSKKYSRFLEGDIRGIFEFFEHNDGCNYPFRSLNSNLHNIYYRYLSNRYKMAAKSLKIDKFKFEIKNEDARQFIQKDNSEYNLIFLDAFSPNKCPCLWSYEFFVELYKHLEPDGMLLTYSNSAAVRSAMIETGFLIGNIYNVRLGKFTGTVAVKNNDLIKYPLSEFDLGLLKTRAGIFYRDENLNAENEAIIAMRNSEVKNSDKISSSQYIKNSKML